MVCIVTELFEVVFVGFLEVTVRLSIDLFLILGFEVCLCSAWCICCDVLHVLPVSF